MKWDFVSIYYDQNFRILCYFSIFLLMGRLEYFLTRIIFLSMGEFFLIPTEFVFLDLNPC